MAGLFEFHHETLTTALLRRGLQVRRDRVTLEAGLVEKPVQDLSVVVMNLAVLHVLKHVVRDTLEHDRCRCRAVEQICGLASIVHDELSRSGC